VPPEERERIMVEYRAAVNRLQRTAYWNLRISIANISIVIGFLALMVVVSGGADGARLAPTLLGVLAGIFGAGVYFSRPYPRITRWLLITSVALTVLGITGLLFVVEVVE
jgi:hypothetical protein